MLAVDLVYDADDLAEFVVLEYYLDEFGLSKRFQFLLWAVKLACVAGLVDGVVLAIVLVDIHPLVKLPQHRVVLLLVQLAYVEPLPPTHALSRDGEHLGEALPLIGVQIHLEFSGKSYEFIHVDDTLVVRVCQFAHLAHELVPAGTQPLEQLLVNLEALVLLDLQVQLAEVVLAEDRLPALRVLAVLLPVLLLGTH